MEERVDGWEAVWSGADERRWLEYALVLAALDIDHELTVDAGTHGLHVPAPVAARARRELAEYAAESRRPPPPSTSPRARGGGLLTPYVVLLTTLFAFERTRVFGFDWLDAGTARAGALLGGDAWRAVTALTLHADGAHLLSNLVFGGLFGVLLAQEVGVGWAGLGLLLSGALGNVVNAAWQPAAHASIGASTGVFGAVGMLMALQRAAARQGTRLRRWAPPIVGAVFLGLLGTAGPRTDVGAHLAGVAVGWLLGRAVSGWVVRWHPGQRRQALPAALALLGVAAAWAWAAAARG